MSDIESMRICEARLKEVGVSEDSQQETHQLTEFLHVVEVSALDAKRCRARFNSFGPGRFVFLVFFLSF